MIRGQKQQFS